MEARDEMKEEARGREEGKKGRNKVKGKKNGRLE